MAKAFIRASDGMIQDELGRWIPHVADNKDYIEARSLIDRGQATIVDEPVNDTPKLPSIDVDVVTTIINEVKKLVEAGGKTVDPKLEVFVSKADESGAVSAEPFEPVKR